MEQPPETRTVGPLLTLEQFLQPANSPPTSTSIDAHLDSIQGATGADDRAMLRVAAYLMRAIALSMPWNEVDGLDAHRFDTRLRAIVPTWRECIGAFLHLEFSRPAPEPESEPANTPEAPTGVRDGGEAD